MRTVDGRAAPGAARDVMIGYACAAFAVTIWAAWIVWTRAAATGAEIAGDKLSAIDIGLMRFGAPALLLAPFWIRGGWRESVKPASTTWPTLIALLGWGAPFVLLISTGMQSSPAAHVGALVPGAAPLWAAIFGWILFRESFPANKRFGLALILAGALLILAPAAVQAISTGAPGPLAGAPWLMAAAAAWACFSVAFRHSGIGPARAAGVVAAYSTAILLVLAAIFGSNLPDLSARALAYHVLTQGVLSGAGSVIAYAMAIERLGTIRAASLSALVPVLAALMAVPALGDALAPLDIAAILSASLGVAFVNGAFSRRAPAQGPL